MPDAAPPPGPPPDLPPRRVLLAEDHPANATVLCTMLQALGWEVDCAADGAGALTSLRQQAYVCCVLDVRMPVLDGIGVARWVRDCWEQPWPRPRLIAATANSSPGELAELAAVGLHEHLAKPISLAQLRRAVGTPHAPGPRRERTDAPPTPLAASPADDGIEWPRLHTLFSVLQADQKPDEVRRLLACLRTESHRAIATLRALPDEATDEAVQLLHRLKGSLSTLSLRGPATTVESAYRQGRLPPTPARGRWLDHLQAAIDHALGVIEARLGPSRS